MANTLVSDVIIPEIYADYQAENSPEKTAFFRSGVAQRNPLLDQLASSGGTIHTLPFWKDIDTTSEPNYSSDDPNTSATPEKIVAAEQLARIAYINKGLSSADLSAEIAGSDPMQRVRNRFGNYWMTQWQRRTIASIQGVLADNVANDDSDMVNDIAGATNADVSASTLFSRSAFTTAAFTSGDHFDDYSAIAVHSGVYKTMVDNDDVEFIPDSESGFLIPTFMGRQVIVDDTLPFTPAGGTGDDDTAPEYTSVLFGNGAIGYGEGQARTPVEIEREAGQGNGGGIETLWERQQWLIHPFGFKFTSDTVTGQSPSWSNLRQAGNWDRVVDRKNVPLAFLVTNG